MGYSLDFSLSGLRVSLASMDKCELALLSLFKQSLLDGISQVLGDEILAPSAAAVTPSSG